MPLYDYTCPFCGRELESFNSVKHRKDEKCPSCNMFMTITIKTSNLRPTFPAGMWENISDEPIWIGSKHQLREECKKHNVRSRYLDDV